MSEPSAEYVEVDYVGMETIWGEGYMSPGGDDEVASVVALAANHDPARVIGIDIQKQRIERAALADDGPSVGVFRDRQPLEW